MENRKYKFIKRLRITNDNERKKNCSNEVKINTMEEEKEKKTFKYIHNEIRGFFELKMDETAQNQPEWQRQYDGGGGGGDERTAQKKMQQTHQQTLHTIETLQWDKQKERRNKNEVKIEAAWSTE